ncbi:MAG: succinate dehydrogenase, hydrophobic membrane anchor protein [Sphingomicrobium sp.]
MSLGESASPLGKVRGTGSAHDGGHHWLSERVTSIALLLLGVWLLASLLFLPSLDQRTLTEWLRAPSAGVPMVLFVITAFIHAIEGLKVAMDDYVHDDGARFGTNLVLLFAAAGGGTLALWALAKIMFGSAG